MTYTDIPTLGINFLDVTIDSEKEALGRNLQEVRPPYEIFVQTRPAGMAYNYDPGNTKMADYSLLEAEVIRVLGVFREYEATRLKSFTGEV